MNSTTDLIYRRNPMGILVIDPSEKHVYLFLHKLFFRSHQQSQLQCCIGSRPVPTLRSHNVGYLRSGFEYLLAGFALFHFLAEITTFQVEFDELYRLYYFISTPNISKSQKQAKTVKSNLQKYIKFCKNCCDQSRNAFQLSPSLTTQNSTSSI